MQVLLFATEECLREEYGAALGAAGHRIVMASTRAAALDHLASHHDGVVVVEGNAPSTAREVLTRARMADGTAIVWCAEAPPAGFSVMHVKTAAGAVACLQALSEDRSDTIRVLAIATEPRLAIDLRRHGILVHEVTSVAEAEQGLRSFDWMVVGDGSLQTVKAARGAGIDAFALVFGAAEWSVQSLVEASRLRAVPVPPTTGDELGEALVHGPRSASGIYAEVPPERPSRPRLTIEMIEAARRALASQGSVRAAARALGISRQDLQYRLRK
jgi:hypothetical protein